VELIIENIRCFAGRHTIPIKPLTFLTGGNSSGKSTFLAALAAVHDPGFPLRPRFNDAPFSLGNFDTIATHKGGRSKRSEQFSLGFNGNKSPGKQVEEVVATYASRKGLVEVSTVQVKSISLTALLTFRAENGRFLVHINASREKINEGYEAAFEVPTGRSSWVTLNNLYYFLSTSQNGAGNDVLLFDLGRMLESVSRPPAFSIAPIRTKPRRTYDQVKEEFDAEGEHMPFVLSELLENESYKKTLEHFGQEAGLFRHISLKRLGKNPGDPVQLFVTNMDREANLLDVGYGVSQALPVVVDSILAPGNQLLLLQEPEVHLHPRAQAALGTLFVELHAENKKQFVVETHSDYIIDRVRQEVARGRVEADDVQILYFEKRGSETTVFPIAIDKRGNVVDPPPSYRDFFMEEEINLLSRAKD